MYLQKTNLEYQLIHMMFIKSHDTSQKGKIVDVLYGTIVQQQKEFRARTVLRTGSECISDFLTYS